MRYQSLLVIALLCLITASGCVRRRMLIRSNPPGALVYVDNQPIGTTPCSTDFVYYGTREIRLVKPGYESLTINQPLPAPWYELPPFDFVSENLIPREIQDYRTLAYNLQPQVIKPSEQLLGDAEALRRYAQQDAVVQTGALGPPAAFSPAATLGAPTLGSPTFVSPSPTAPTLTPETVGPGLLVPPTPGAGTLPPGGRTLEALPAP